MKKLVALSFLSVIYDHQRTKRKLEFTPDHTNTIVTRTNLKLSEIKKDIPEHVFKSSVSKSMFYFVRDLIFLYAGYEYIYKSKLDERVKVPLFSLYMGTIGASFFMIAHDCGHGSFSKYKLLNFIIGLFSNTVFLVPYFPWRLAHKNHHIHIQDIEKDEVYYPKENENSMLFYPWFGWPMYLLTGRNSRGSDNTSFFDIKNPLLKDDKIKCLVSQLTVVGYLFTCLKKVSSKNLLCYALPSIVVHNAWLILITALHHNDESIVYLNGSDEVSHMCQSMDRTYGLLTTVIHNIGTHQVHHLNAQIPHYNLAEATYYFRKKYPEMVKRSTKNTVFEFIRLSIKRKKKNKFKNGRKYKVFSQYDAL